MKQKRTNNMKMKIGYIRENDLKLNPHLTERFQFKEATFTRRICAREPFLLDDELRKKVTKWVEWANNVDPSEYDPFHSKEGV